VHAISKCERDSDCRFILSSCDGRIKMRDEQITFIAMQGMLSDFCRGKEGWADYVRNVWDMQKALKVSDDVFDDVITHIESLAGEIINTAGTI
jgi:hypothetical protein